VFKDINFLPSTCKQKKRLAAGFGIINFLKALKGTFIHDAKHKMHTKLYAGNVINVHLVMQFTQRSDQPAFIYVF
jgi:hypothetical protein